MMMFTMLTMLTTMMVVSAVVEKLALTWPRLLGPALATKGDERWIAKRALQLLLAARVAHPVFSARRSGPVPIPARTPAGCDESRCPRTPVAQHWYRMLVLLLVPARHGGTRKSSASVATRLSRVSAPACALWIPLFSLI